MNRTAIDLVGGWKIQGFDLEHGLAAGAFKKDYLPKESVTAGVPTTVRNALFSAGKIPDPYKGFNSLDTKWIEETFAKRKQPAEEKGQKASERNGE